MPSLTFKELRKANLSRAVRWHSGGLDTWSLSDWAVALSGEVGEACNIVKKLNRTRDGIPGNRETYQELLISFEDELADIQIYLDLLAARAGINLSEATIRKFNQVSEKLSFPERLG